MTGKRLTKAEREGAYRESFLARLSARLARPTPEWPTVRCWTAQSLKRLCRQVREDLAREGLRSHLSHESLLGWVSRLGLEKEIAAEGETFQVVEVGAPLVTSADPLELLLAARPAGVICYFTAVAFHGLTTQPARHHHVAELRAPAPRGGRDGENTDRNTGENRVEAPGPSGTSGPRLGRLLFQYEAVPYYSTRRSSRLVPGVQSRGHGPRTELRITTLEQTLLDALYKPFHCGGPEVVFEAWHEAWASHRVNEARLADHLKRMQYPATARRVGVMLEIVGHAPGQELAAVLDAAREAIDRDSPFASISLLPGVGYSSLNQEWLVHTP